MSLSSFHLVSDFDGVWTDPSREFNAVREAVIRELAHCLGGKEDLARDTIAWISKRILDTPADFGWQACPDDERLSSYVDEDCFCLPAAIGHYLTRPKLEPQATLARDAFQQNWPDMSALMDHCFHSTCDEFRQKVQHDLAPAAEESLDELLSSGIRVTFVSNAPPEKIQDWFACHGFTVEDARDANASSNLRVYGRAGKQWLGVSDRALNIGGRSLFTDRPQYREILEREAPDLVLGDVLSLDLALPLALRKEGHPSAPQFVALLARSGPPEWVQNSIGKEGPDYLLSDIRDLPDLIRSITGAQLSDMPSRA